MKKTPFQLADQHNVPWFNAGIYPVQIFVHDVDNIKPMRKIWPHFPECTEVNGRCTWKRTERYNLIAIGLNKNSPHLHATIAHECYHAMNRIYAWMGCQHDAENDEPGAYLLTLLCEEVAKAWRRIDHDTHI